MCASVRVGEGVVGQDEKSLVVVLVAMRAAPAAVVVGGLLLCMGIVGLHCLDAFQL